MTFQICAKKKVADRNPVLCRSVPGEMLQGDTSMSGLCEVDRDVSANYGTACSCPSAKMANLLISTVGLSSQSVSAVRPDFILPLHLGLCMNHWLVL